MTALGMPDSRIIAVRARVSTPVRPMIPRARSQSSSRLVARWLDASPISARKIAPSAPAEAARLTVSMSSSFVPTTPMWGKVKVMIWPA